MMDGWNNNIIGWKNSEILVNAYYIPRATLSLDNLNIFEVILKYNFVKIFKKLGLKAQALSIRNPY